MQELLYIMLQKEDLNKLSNYFYLMEVCFVSCFIHLAVAFKIYGSGSVCHTLSSFNLTDELIIACVSANALVMNDDCQTPLDVARSKGFSNVVRAIEVF